MKVLFLVALPLVVATVGFCNDKDISCGVCSLMCSDREEHCASWAKEGECTSSPDYMLKECPTSCGLCAPKCADVHVDCNHWGKEGVCKGLCKDTHDDCPGWAKEGECVANPGHTLKT